ncbi:MAG: hypothetical protein NZR01_18095 [Bryobacteraceae bacterium]|nr:hypothetical protein [Bryobacteraceae bacterium]
MAIPTMSAPQLKPEEWELLGQLLECKQRELLAELRHTTKRAFREALHERLEQVEELLRKIPRQEPPAEC